VVENVFCIQIIYYTIVFNKNNVLLLAPFTGHLYSTADIRNPRRRSTPMHGFAVSKTGTGEGVRIQMLETLDREMC
jgi:hypothetical protein